MKAKEWILEIMVYLLAMLMLITAGSKLADLNKFKDQINNQPFDNRFTPALTYGVPIVELLLAVGLLLPKRRRTALYGTALLMTVFTIYIALVTFNFYERVPCGCAFAFEKLSWPQHLVMNLTFTLMAFAAIYIIKKHKQPTS